MDGSLLGCFTLLATGIIGIYLEPGAVRRSSFPLPDWSGLGHVLEYACQMDLIPLRVISSDVLASGLVHYLVPSSLELR